MVEAADETQDMVVITVMLPRGREIPAVTVCEHTVTVVGAGGYRREVTLPLDADVGRLHAQLYDRYLELRAPRAPEPPERPVLVQVLRQER